MAKSWSSEEIAIKNALKKSGTDLVAFETLRKQEKETPQSSNMVYYQAAPLIMKSKHVGAERFCSPGQQNYSLNNCNSLSMQRQLTPTANNAISATVTSSINSAQQQQQQQQQQYQHLHVKNEPLQQPDITHVQQQQQQQQHMIISPTTNTNNMTIKAVYNSNNTQSNINPYNNASTSINVMQPVKGSRSTTTMAEMRNKPQFKCDYCGMTFGSKSAHTSHTKSHTKNGELGITSVVNNREMHERSGMTGCIPKQPEIKVNINAVNTGSDPYQCNVCQKTFAVPARLIRHYRTHTGERPFECEFCHKLFSVKENLQVHRRIHTKERPYKCDVCGRAFEHSGKLHRHMRIHTGERPHKCETCGKTFIQSGQLVIHIRTHTGEKPYKCPVQGCKKDFTCSKQLKVHSRIHTGEKPYQCEFCHKCFGYNHVLKLHRRSHLATKCFQCNICEVTLISKKAIEAHIKGHANTIPVNVEEGGGSDVAKATTTSATIKATSSSSSASSGVESISSPNSPQSLAQKTKTDTFPNHYTTRSISPLSPGSATASISSSNSSYHSLSPHSISSPQSPTTSPNLDNNQQYSYDQHTPTVQTYQKAAPTTATNTSLRELKSPLIYRAASEEEMPTDLRITPITTESQTAHIFDYQSYPDQNIQYYYFNPSAATLQSPAQFITPTDRTHTTKMDEPTINPALLEAACMASRREVTLDDVEQAAIQIMQLHHNQRKSYTEVTTTLPPSTSTTHTPLQSQSKQPSATSTCAPLFLNEMTTFDYGDDDGSAHVDELQPYKNAELIKQPLNKGCAPVPKFQSSLQNNDIILRQVEAAIAPLRLSSDSPERSSSPDSDCDRFLLMADRDVMTLPLRKRKLYMSQPKKQDDNDTIKAKIVPTKTASAPTTTITNDTDKGADLNSKVMRHNSVIQFAKAS